MATTNSNGAASPAPRPRRHRRKSWPRRIAGFFLKTIGTLLLVGICTGAILACYAVVYVQTIIMPQAEQVLSSIDMFDVSQSSSMFYTDKETGAKVEMLTLRGSEDRIWVEYKDIPKNLINATIAIEDKRFYKHQGVDWIRTAKGLINMFTGQDIQGGSTITQQLIKNVTQYDDVTVKRKILEIFTALEFERSHSKEEILEWYLNYIYLGDGCNGVNTAALNYFGKELQDLTLPECASLISITNNPSLYNPYRNPDANIYRRNLTLDMMADPEQGFISQEECDAAKATKLELKRETGTSREQEIFTWYEDQVIADVIEDLQTKCGFSKEMATNLIYYGGLHIETCFDPDVQAYVDAIYNDRAILEVDSKTGQEIQSAITVIDNRTGNVVALSGGIGEKESSRTWNRATDTIRPPGSSIKPLAVYAPALDMGLMTPATVIDDVPVMLINQDGLEVKPENMEQELASGGKVSVWPANSYNYYKGLTTVYEALEDSVNTIAVRVMRDMVTPNVSYQYMTERFGITSLEPAREENGLILSDIDLAPLALGGLTDGVSTYEMAAAYATFANNGMYKTPRTYLRVVAVDTNGRETVLLENTSASEAVLKESTVFYMNTMLQNVISWNGTGHDAMFDSVDMTIAGKTGTTTSNKDKWFVGYSPYYTAAVWVGYDIQERIPDSGYLAAKLWKQVMEPLHSGLENTGFKQPEDVVTVKYCKDSGLIATEWCGVDARGSRVVEGTFLKGDEPTQYCTLHVMQEICMDSPILKEDGTPTGMYHAYGPFCPAESKNTVAVIDHYRIRLNETVTTRDDFFMKNYIAALENGGLCAVHNVAPYDPSIFDPMLPSTWPNDPNLSIFDETTWPNYVPPIDPDDPTTWPMDDLDFDPLDPTTWPESDPGYVPSEDEEEEEQSSIRNWLNGLLH